MISLKKLSNGIEKNLQAKLQRANSLQSFLNRNVYAMYQNFQRTRWMTEGSSEGQQWAPLSPTYAKYKLKRYSEYPGGGSKMLIATQKLFNSVVGPGQGQRKVVTNRQLTIYTNTDYANFVDEKRNFTKWSSNSMIIFYNAITSYVFKNILTDEAKIGGIT